MHRQSLIAVVGMDGIFPGAPDLNTFWHNIVNGIDQSAAVPEDRWIAPVSDRFHKTLALDHTYSRHACLIHDFTFDPDRFRLDANLTRHLDPVHQLTLTAGKRAIEGCKTVDIDPACVDVILAAIALPTDSASAFSRQILGHAIEKRLFPNDAHLHKKVSRIEALASRVDGLPAALLAAEMGFGGDSFTLDAACASSMYAVKLACDALIAKRADMVVTGGVSRPECLYTQSGFSQLQALSPSGRCSPFDQNADGLVVGEGVGILVLKRLSDALDQGDTIHGVIHGIGLSNDMQGNLLAPESKGQVRAMEQAYQFAKWRPSDVDLIECHGTGTRAGDTTEIHSLVQLWKEESASGGDCAIGSVKSMIGHLLTAAGAAGMIKTLLAMQHHTLPPTIHFEAPPANSPLVDSPFIVQTRPASWYERSSGCPRRAAVSAFGFGGINAHLLFEQWQKSTPGKKGVGASPISLPGRADENLSCPVAIVGMETSLGTLNGLKAFEQALFAGRSVISQRPSGRWKEADRTLMEQMDGFDPRGSYLENLSLGIGDFQIPPNEINDILPQQLLALQTGAGALVDAGLPLREPRERMGVVVGIEFDFEATNYHLRWQLADAVRRWDEKHALKLDEPSMKQWLELLRTQCGPPLTPSRVLGALGGIVASRMAREFRFGGPSFVVSANTSSGIKALRIAIDQLQQNAVDAMLVGAVDLAGEGRSVVRLDRVSGLSRNNWIHPFDDSADGTLPGDGAIAMVLKRLDRSLAENDRIYAVVHGIGAASGGDPLHQSMDETIYRRSLSRCISQSRVSKEDISLVETHGSGVSEQDRMELTALQDFFFQEHPMDAETSIALSATTPICGHTGAAHGLVSVVKTALCLYHHRLPSIPEFRKSNHPLMQSHRFHIPIKTQPWYRDRESGPRTAVSASVSMDGTCSHVLLQEEKSEISQVKQVPVLFPYEDRAGLFIVTGNDETTLNNGLFELERLLAKILGQHSVETAAARWMELSPPENETKLAVALILQPGEKYREVIKKAQKAIEMGGSDTHSQQVFYKKNPMGDDTQIAMIYPGSGNHYLGMGRELALRFPDIIDRMDQNTARLKTQFRPWHLMPWQQSWETSWERQALADLTSDPLNMIFGQVMFGGLMTHIFNRFEIQTDAVIGYSLGESAALFAHGVWADRGDMLERMQDTDLFTTQLAGPCQALRKAWKISSDEPVQWRVAVVNRPVEVVRKTLVNSPHARLLIVNTPDECVIGGMAAAVKQAISDMGCQAVFLDGVVTVHCDAAQPVAEAYRDLHRFPVNPRPDLTVYSCSWAKPYTITSDKIADSIKKQAVDGFNFTQTIKRAAKDGIGVFIEAGPGSSCTRMIDRILSDRPHVAVAANHGNENELITFVRCLACLAAERVPMNLRSLYAHVDTTILNVSEPHVPTVKVPVGGQCIHPTLPERRLGEDQAKSIGSDNQERQGTRVVTPQHTIKENRPGAEPSAADRWKGLIEKGKQQVEATAAAHQQFLKLSGELTQTFAETFDLQNRMLQQGAKPQGSPTKINSLAPSTIETGGSVVAFSREKCMAFAIGKVGEVLGPAFDVVDTHRVRVRLPDEPLMLVDRILSVEGEMLTMGSGKVVTEHDVLPGAWYLDGDRAPVCISVEAGQADLFLCSYLGIDHKVKGERAYRLLDAVVTFHRGLPRPGEVVRYEIAIDRFVRQGETWMFFFRFEGYIGNQHLITMEKGCAGFFTETEVNHSGGIILTEQERRPASGNRPANWRPLVPMARESFSDTQVNALRKGDLAGCFGPRFDGISLATSLHLPDGHMRLIHRIVDLDPQGGRYGIGMIRAEADIHPNDWFLTCHFVDDRVMPGTLMYECCAHALRVYLQRLGWVTDKPGVCYEPLIGNGARLKCRGPVTPATRHVHYEIQISEIGYNPEPYVIADAHMFADGQFIVFFKNMSMKMTGIHREEIEALWEKSQQGGEQADSEEVVPPLYDKDTILAFAVGDPSKAFGEPYRVFDCERKIARLPGPPYCFMDRVIHVEPEPWKLKAGGWVTAEYDVPENEWYFSADRSGFMPLCVLLEIALQPCGWLAAYAGSALRSQQDLKFRNLGGSAILHRQVTSRIGRVTMRCRMTKVSEAADMIIENFDFEVLSGNNPVYTGETYFGFFSADALNQQKGLGQNDPMVITMAKWNEYGDGAQALPVNMPYTPEEASKTPLSVNSLLLPSKALLMIDNIDAYSASDGSEGGGYLRGIKQVDPDEWFFKAHFHQDPVCPGSLGIESFLQLIKFAALKHWPHYAATHRFCMVEGSKHNWIYRGQIVPENRKITVLARVIKFQDGSTPQIEAEGLLTVDDLPIYKMENFTLVLVRATDLPQQGRTFN